MDVAERVAIYELAMIIAAQNSELVTLRLRVQELQNYKDSEEIPF